MRRGGQWRRSPAGGADRRHGGKNGVEQVGLGTTSGRRANALAPRGIDCSAAWVAVRSGLMAEP